MAESKKVVVVVGAGMAGISAARDLVDNGNFDVTIVEAQDKIGGRIWTESLGNAKVDLGAAWLHQMPEITKLVKKMGISRLETDWESMAAWKWSGEEYKEADLLRAYEEGEKVFEELNEFETSATQTDMSVQQFLESKNFNWKTPENGLIIAEMLESWMGTSIKNISATAFYEFEEGDTEKDHMPNGGYQQVLEKMIKPVDGRGELKIEKSQIINRIEKTEDKCMVTADTGRTYTADHVVVTVPIGVLKTNTIQFVPQLSQKKTEAIRRIGFGLLNKVVFQFDKAFWPNKQFFGLSRADGDPETHRGLFTMWVNLHYAVKQPILVCLITGEAAYQVEGFSDDEVRSKGLEALKKMFGKSVDSAKVLRMLRTKWNTYKYSLGAYSYIPVLKAGESEKELIKNAGSAELDGLVHFAGEHTLEEYGTVEAALVSGRRAAKEITKTMPSRARSLFSNIAGWLGLAISLALLL